MAFEVIEGIHYIFDRYAFLNQAMEDGGEDSRVTPESTPEDFEKAIKLARALHHPDRQARAGKKRQAEAERKTRLVADCEKFLLNSRIKPLYDARLEEFQRDKAHLVSTSGDGIIDPLESHFDVNSLLSEDIPDTSDYAAHVAKMMNYDESKTKQAEDLFNAMPDNPQIRSLYRTALTYKFVYLTLLENAAWAKVGWVNIREEDKTSGRVTESSEYTNYVEDALAEAADHKIADALAQRSAVAQIGLTSMPLLLTSGESEGDNQEQETQALMDPAQMAAVIAKLHERARQTFDARADHVREAAAAKQAVLEKLVTLSPVTNLNTHDPADPVYHIYLTEENDERVFVRFDMDVSTGKFSIGETFTKETTLAAIRAQGLTGNSIALERNKELVNLFLEATCLANKLLREYQAKLKQEPESPAPDLHP